MSGPMFTKGPWSAARGDALVFIECPNVAHVGVTDGDAYAAPYVVYAAPDAGGDPRANARLISAAPELLEVLQAMVEAECDYMRINNLGDPEKQHNIKWARRVLSKASPSEKGE